MRRWDEAREGAAGRVRKRMFGSPAGRREGMR